MNKFFFGIIQINIVLCQGYLDSSSNSEDIAVGSSLELPCWMARALHAPKVRAVTPKLPNTYRPQYRCIFFFYMYTKIVIYRRNFK